MGKIQAYGDLASFFRNSSDFLLEEEFANNLFWEVYRNFRENGKTAWSGNVFLKGKILLSGVIMPSGYLLLSSGTEDASLRLANYGKKKKWKIRGVTGPDQSATSFGREWLKGRKESPVCKKEFMIYSTSCLSFLEGRQPTELKVAESANWPRVQAWTTLFANESVPPLDCNALLSMSRAMMLKGNLFLLHKQGVGTCAMGGFGRSTPSSLVINEVFVPKELRGMRYGEDLIAGLVSQAKAREKSHCILFSDYRGRKNLYDRLGFEKTVKFCELSF